MKLSYYASTPPNFGDALNEYIWPRILPPGVLDNDQSELFIGFGSILGEGFFDRVAVKHVLGAGYAGYTRLPDLASGNWDIVFVRGPRTAASIGVDAKKYAICDSAILIREIADLPSPTTSIGTAFMPHHDSVHRGQWREVCARAGVHFIDPAAPLETVISEILGARLLITEAMHGAIVADALRTPWVAAKPLIYKHHAKWLDWADSLQIDLRFLDVPKTSLKDVISGFSRKDHYRLNDSILLRSPVAGYIDAPLISNAAKWMRRIADSSTGQLSSDMAIKSATERAKAAVDSFAAVVLSRTAT